MDATQPGHDGPHGSIVARCVGAGLLTGSVVGLFLGASASGGALEMLAVTMFFGTLVGTAVGGALGALLAPLVRRLARTRTGRPTLGELATVAGVPVVVVLVLVGINGAFWHPIFSVPGALSLLTVVVAVVRLLPWCWAPLRGAAPVAATAS